MDTKQIAQELLAALDAGKTVPSVVARQPGFDWDEGYAVLAEILEIDTAEVAQLTTENFHRLFTKVPRNSVVP